MAEMCVSRSEFEKVKADNSELKRDAAIWRSLIVLGEGALAVTGGAMAVTGNLGPFGSSNDSLVRTGFLVGSIAAGVDAGRRTHSIYKMATE